MPRVLPVVALTLRAFAIATVLVSCVEGGGSFELPPRAVDREGPANASVALEGGRTLLNSNQVMLAISGSDEEGPLEMALSNDSSFATASWVPLASPYPWSLVAGEGVRTVYLKLRDALGNESAPVFASVTVDLSPPAGASVVLEGGRAWARSRSVTAVLTAVDPSPPLRVGCSEVAGAPALNPFAETSAFTLSETEGPHQVHCRFEDGAGNGVEVASNVVFLDATPPPTPSLRILGTSLADGFTNTASVFLEIAAAEAAQLVASNSADAAGCPESEDWQATTRFMAWQLAPGPDGERSVYLRSRDEAGNPSACVNASIVLDRTPPTAPLISSDGEAVRGEAAWLNILERASDLHGLSHYEFMSSAHPAWQAMLPDATLFRASLRRNSENTVQVRAVDRAGNLGDPSPAVRLVEKSAERLEDLPLMPSLSLSLAGDRVIYRDSGGGLRLLDLGSRTASALGVSSSASFIAAAHTLVHQDPVSGDVWKRDLVSGLSERLLLGTNSPGFHRPALSDGWLAFDDGSSVFSCRVATGSCLPTARSHTESGTRRCLAPLLHGDRGVFACQPNGAGESFVVRVQSFEAGADPSALGADAAAFYYQPVLGVPTSERIEGERPYDLHGTLLLTSRRAGTSLAADLYESVAAGGTGTATPLLQNAATNTSPRYLGEHRLTVSKRSGTARLYEVMSSEPGGGSSPMTLAPFPLLAAPVLQLGDPSFHRVALCVQEPSQPVATACAVHLLDLSSAQALPYPLPANFRFDVSGERLVFGRNDREGTGFHSSVVLVDFASGRESVAVVPQSPGLLSTTSPDAIALSGDLLAWREDFGSSTLPARDLFACDLRDCARSTVRINQVLTRDERNLDGPVLSGAAAVFIDRKLGGSCDAGCSGGMVCSKDLNRCVQRDAGDLFLSRFEWTTSGPESLRVVGAERQISPSAGGPFAMPALHAGADGAVRAVFVEAAAPHALYLYDDSGALCSTPDRLCKVAEQAAWPVVSEGWVAWLDRTAVGGRIQAKAMQLFPGMFDGTGTAPASAVQVLEGDHGAGALSLARPLSLDGERLAVNDAVGASASGPVFLYDLRQALRVRLSAPGFDARGLVKVAGDRVFWVDAYEGTVRVWDFR